MESSEFDATLGGTEHLPHSANNLKFVASRSVEIAAMTESILHPSKTKLIFQTLPVHMRRRVMSHNCKRLPRKLREGHYEQLKKSGLAPVRKRPSRKYRRRPVNLLEEYNRRQRKNIWLETHIWHAKRFHMIEIWGYRLPNAPCDKAFRACYRASSAHCLMQDMSYYTPLQITGSLEAIQNMFSPITSQTCGLSICAKAYVSGKREGTIYLYRPHSFPYDFIGQIDFIWVSNTEANKSLWLFVHPSQTKEVEAILNEVSNIGDSDERPAKRRKLSSGCEGVSMKAFWGGLNRFRLTGPNSHAILVRSLKCVEDFSKIKIYDWVSSLKTHDLYLKEKYEYWQNVTNASSPSQLPPRVIIGLVVRDPRLSRPNQRTKAKCVNKEEINLETLVNIPQSASASPLWSSELCDIIKNKKVSNGQFIEHITKNQLIPGEINTQDPTFQCVPIVLIQRPGSQDSNYKKLGYGSGWDIIMPPSYGLPFWQTFIMFGARSGGLRETKSMDFEMGKCYLPPDCAAGYENEKRTEIELKEKYFRIPPSKRVNYVKLGINSPFICPWKILLNDWNHNPIQNFFVLRDKKLIDKLQDNLVEKKNIPEIDNGDSCLLAVYIKILSKGYLKKHALICLPEPDDIAHIKSLYEPHHRDPNVTLRKQKRAEHAKEVKRKRRMKIKARGKNNEKPQKKKLKNVPSEYVKAMRELWLPSTVTGVRHLNTRQVMGYLTEGAFSFTEARSCGIGYIAYNGLRALLQRGLNQVLIRNTTTRKYRLADVTIIKI